MVTTTETPGPTATPSHPHQSLPGEASLFGSVQEESAPRKMQREGKEREQSMEREREREIKKKKEERQERGETQSKAGSSREGEVGEREGLLHTGGETPENKLYCFKNIPQTHPGLPPRPWGRSMGSVSPAFRNICATTTCPASQATARLEHSPCHGGQTTQAIARLEHSPCHGGLITFVPSSSLHWFIPRKGRGVQVGSGVLQVTQPLPCCPVGAARLSGLLGAPGNRLHGAWPHPHSSLPNSCPAGHQGPGLRMAVSAIPSPRKCTPAAV